MAQIAELRNVTKNFDTIKALENINLQINKGEILGLLGPNGSGKTTLLRILAFIQKPSKGEVYFNQVRVTDRNIEQIRLESTMVFQKTLLFNTTVYNNVAYGLKIRKTPKEKIADEVGGALKLLRLEGFEKRRARRLSGGEQQRVAIATALVLNPKLLLLDEPTANLDPKNASLVEEAIATVNREKNTTIVIATHNMFQAKRLPHRLALIADGKITGIGTPTETFNKLSRTLAGFGAVENVFQGTATPANSGITTVNIGNDVQVATATQCQGSVSIFIAPEDIIVSKKRFESSARNVFMGRIIEITDVGSLVKIRVDVGKPLITQITKRSFDEMGLNMSSEVFLTFKASSVQIV